MVTTRGLVVGVVVLHKVRRILRQRVHYAASTLIGARRVIGRPLGCPCGALLVASFLAVGAAEVTLAGNTRHVVHGHGRGGFNAWVECGSVHGHATPAADADDANRIGVYVVTAA